MNINKGKWRKWLAAASVAVLVGLLAFDGASAQKSQKINTSRRTPVRERLVQRRLPDRVMAVRPPSFQGPKYAQDRVLVKFKPGVTAQSRDVMIRTFNFPNVRMIPKIEVYRIQVPQGMTVEETLFLLRSNPDVEYAEPVYRVRAFTTTPNDPYFMPYQYNLYNRGVVLDISPEIQPRTTAGADIKAREAWDITKGKDTVVIGVLDSGIDMTHIELRNKYVSSGHDFVNDDSDATDDFWHGTFVAGIAAAETNNNQGIAGVAWNAKILPVKVLDDEGNGYYDALIEAIVWAVDNGAKVLNLSLGGEEADSALEAACRYAFEHNVIVVAAAGNEYGPVAYPAAYDDYVLAVGATDYDDLVADFSNTGPQVDVAAPGVLILSCIPQWLAEPGYPPYGFGSGTSAAAPHVAGFAALVLSAKPWISARDLMNLIRFTADDVNSAQHKGKDDYIGYGRINMSKALVPYILR